MHNIGKWRHVDNVISGHMLFFNVYHTLCIQVYTMMKEKGVNFVICQCTSTYPLPIEDVNLNVIQVCDRPGFESHSDDLVLYFPIRFSILQDSPITVVVLLFVHTSLNLKISRPYNSEYELFWSVRILYMNPATVQTLNRTIASSAAYSGRFSSPPSSHYSVFCLNIIIWIWFDSHVLMTSLYVHNFCLNGWIVTFVIVYIFQIQAFKLRHTYTI